MYPAVVCVIFQKQSITSYPLFDHQIYQNLEKGLIEEPLFGIGWNINIFKQKFKRIHFPYADTSRIYERKKKGGGRNAKIYFSTKHQLRHNSRSFEIRDSSKIISRYLDISKGWIVG